jgi:hypothetical protein
MQQFFLKVTKESLTNNLEQVDALLDKLFLLVEPIKIFSALANKSGPYAAVLEAVGKLELDSEDPISNESTDTTSLTPVVSAEIFADVEQNEIGDKDGEVEALDLVVDRDREGTTRFVPELSKP